MYYRDIPSAELENSIKWVEQTILDCERRLDELHRIKRDRERAQRHRDSLRRMMERFCNEYYEGMDKNAMRGVLKQHFGNDYPEHRIKAALDIWCSWAKREQRKRRNEAIKLYSRSGVHSAQELARKFKMTRQQVYNIIKS